MRSGRDLFKSEVSFTRALGSKRRVSREWQRQFVINRLGIKKNLGIKCDLRVGGGLKCSRFKRERRDNYDLAKDIKRQSASPKWTDKATHFRDSTLKVFPHNCYINCDYSAMPVATC